MSTLPFHPLAEIFPLIEGAEFDELVSSIKESGQREPIILLEGAILDGRNRYRACQVAQVEPITKIFNGADPVRFVVDINVRRRHLNESQRAMIAARLADMSVGRPCSTREIGEISPIPVSATTAAEMMNVSRHTVQNAKTVLAEGTPQEIHSVQEGKAAVSTIARQIRANASPTQRQKQAERSLGSIGKNPERLETQRLNAEMWQRLSDALEHLTNLPNPADVAVIVRSNTKRSDTTNARLDRSLKWLEEFAHEWRGSRECDHAHAREGDGDA